MQFCKKCSSRWSHSRLFSVLPLTQPIVPRDTPNNERCLPSLEVLGVYMCTSLTSSFAGLALRTLGVTDPEICQVTFMPFNMHLLPDSVECLKLKLIYVNDLSGQLPLALQEVTIDHCRLNPHGLTCLASASCLRKLLLVDSNEHMDYILKWALGTSCPPSMHTWPSPRTSRTSSTRSSTIWQNYLSDGLLLCQRRNLPLQSIVPRPLRSLSRC